MPVLRDEGGSQAVPVPVPAPVPAPPQPQPVAPQPTPQPIILPGQAFIDTADILEPPALIPAPARIDYTPPPSAPTVAPPPAAPTTVAPSSSPAITPRPIIPAGQAFIDTADIFEPPALIAAPPRADFSAPPEEPMPNGDGEASARGPSLWDYGDPLSEEEFDLFGNPPLEGQRFIAEVQNQCDRYDIDWIAMCVNGVYEGFGGGIGDSGEAYGPWQDWMTHFVGRPWYGAGINNAKVNAWAWSAAGIEYSVRSASHTRAKGETGPQAAYDIAYYYERPLNRVHDSLEREDAYRVLVAQHIPLADYFAGRAKGPAGDKGSQTTPAPTPPRSVKPGVGPTGNWHNLIDYLSKDLHSHVSDYNRLYDSLVEVFK